MPYLRIKMMPVEKLIVHPVTHLPTVFQSQIFNQKSVLSPFFEISGTIL